MITSINSTLTLNYLRLSGSLLQFVSILIPPHNKRLNLLLAPRCGELGNGKGELRTRPLRVVYPHERIPHVSRRNSEGIQREVFDVGIHSGGCPCGGVMRHFFFTLLFNV